MEKSKYSKADDLTGAFQQVPEAATRAMTFDQLTDSGKPGPLRDLDMVLDLPLNMSVELGRVRLPIGQLLSLHSGAVIELDVKAGDPLNIMVNGCLVARGDIVIVNDKYGIRLTEIVTPSERLRNLRH